MSHISTRASTAVTTHHLVQQLYRSTNSWSDMQHNYSGFAPIDQLNEDSMQSGYLNVPLDSSGQPNQYYGVQGLHNPYGEVGVGQGMPPGNAPYHNPSWVAPTQQPPQGLMPDYTQQAPNGYMLPSSFPEDPRHSSLNPYPTSRDVSPSACHPAERSFYSGPSAGPPRLRNPHACEKCRIRKAKCSGGQPCERCMVKGLTCEYNSERRKSRGVSDRSPTASSSSRDTRQEHYDYPVGLPNPDAMRRTSGGFDGTYTTLNPLGVSLQPGYPGMSSARDGYAAPSQSYQFSPGSYPQEGHDGHWPPSGFYGS